MPARKSDLKVKDLTYEQWLAGSSENLLEGFREWQEAYYHWRRGHQLGWAIRCYKNSKAWRKLEWQKAKAARNVTNRPTPS